MVNANEILALDGKGKCDEINNLFIYPKHFGNVSTIKRYI